MDKSLLDRNLAVSIEIIKGKTLEDAGNDVGISKQRAKNILDKLIRHAMHPNVIGDFVVTPGCGKLIEIRKNPETWIKLVTAATQYVKNK